MTPETIHLTSDHYGKGIQGMDGETAIKLFQEGAKR